VPVDVEVRQWMMRSIGKTMNGKWTYNIIGTQQHPTGSEVDYAISISTVSLDKDRNTYNYHHLLASSSEIPLLLVCPSRRRPQ
jgi:hypothetical protein